METTHHMTDPVWSPSLYKISKIIVSKNEPVLYYLNGEYSPSQAFVCEELMLINLSELQYSSQSILEDNDLETINFIHISDEFLNAQQYADKCSGSCHSKIGQINNLDVYL